MLTFSAEHRQDVCACIGLQIPSSDCIVQRSYCKNPIQTCRQSAGKVLEHVEVCFCSEKSYMRGLMYEP